MKKRNTNLFRLHSEVSVSISLYFVEEVKSIKGYQFNWKRISPIYESIFDASKWLQDLHDGKVKRVLS